MVALVECMQCKMQHFLLLRCSNLQLIRILQAETGYIQSPPPGCPKAIYKVMVQCWWVSYVVEYHVVLSGESCKLAKGAVAGLDCFLYQLICVGIARSSF